MGGWPEVSRGPHGSQDPYRRGAGKSEAEVGGATKMEADVERREEGP